MLVVTGALESTEVLCSTMAGEVVATVHGFLTGSPDLVDISPAAHPWRCTLLRENLVTISSTAPSRHSEQPVGHSKDTSPPRLIVFSATMEKFFRRSCIVILSFWIHLGLHLTPQGFGFGMQLKVLVLGSSSRFRF